MYEQIYTDHRGTPIAHLIRDGYFEAAAYQLYAGWRSGGYGDRSARQAAASRLQTAGASAAQAARSVDVAARLWGDGRTLMFLPVFTDSADDIAALIKNA